VWNIVQSEETYQVRRTYRYFPLFLLLICAQFASAQGAFDAYVGLGIAHVKTNGSGLDSLQSTNAFGSCDITAGDQFCQRTGALNGLFMSFGGDVMVHKHFGFGANVSIQPMKRDYGPIQYRQLFYDFDGIYAPIATKRVSLRLEGGAGGANTNFSYSQNSCVGTAVCSTTAQSIGSSSHFQVHAGVGVQFSITDHIFIRPQFDYHYVPNLTQQFGSNSVPQGTIYVGYNFGEK
jgi:opacity protein-like surface antigen